MNYTQDSMFPEHAPAVEITDNGHVWGGVTVPRTEGWTLLRSKKAVIGWHKLSSRQADGLAITVCGRIGSTITEENPLIVECEECRQ